MLYASLCVGLKYVGLKYVWYVVFPLVYRTPGRMGSEGGATSEPVLYVRLRFHGGGPPSPLQGVTAA